MAKQKALVRLVAKRDGTVKTAGWREVDAVPVGVPFNIQSIMVSGREPDRTYLEERFRERDSNTLTAKEKLKELDFDAYSVGKGVSPFERTAPKGYIRYGDTWKTVCYATFPVQLFRLK